MLIASVSYGNDSIALIQWLHEHEYPAREPVVCAYLDTGWASKEWPTRVTLGELLASRYGFATTRIQSIGFVPLARLKKAWPYDRARFCTEHLKVLPFAAWAEEIDPAHEATVVIGIRREESDGRSQWPERIEDSDRHGGRDAWFPLVRVLEPERDALIRRSGFEPLPHRSRECYPCIESGKEDLRDMPEDRIAYIESLEAEMGETRNGKPRTLFRPKPKGGAVGIRQVVEWANSDRGAYLPGQTTWFLPRGGCDSGFCGT